MTWTLNRTARDSDGVRGRLFNGTSIPFYSAYFTQEDDWLNNQHGVSCIPAGTFRMVRTIYHKHGYETFEIIVPGRNRILIHPGNTEEDTDGCILIGLREGTFWVHDEDDLTHPLVQKKGVVDSREAFFHGFMPAMIGIDEDTLVVNWGPGLP